MIETAAGIETVIEDARWTEALGDAQALATCCFDAARQGRPELAGEVALLLADDATLSKLNARFRGRDKPTNVLSFPSGETPPGFIGDIALAFETCEKEAAEKSIVLADHAAHLIVHGLLHLAGHDHEEDAEAEVMEALEVDILDAIGVSNPYSSEKRVK